MGLPDTVTQLFFHSNRGQCKQTRNMEWNRGSSPHSMQESVFPRSMCSELLYPMVLGSFLSQLEYSDHTTIQSGKVASASIQLHHGYWEATWSELCLGIGKVFWCHWSKSNKASLLREGIAPGKWKKSTGYSERNKREVDQTQWVGYKALSWIKLVLEQRQI